MTTPISTRPPVTTKTTETRLPTAATATAVTTTSTALTTSFVRARSAQTLQHHRNFWRFQNPPVPPKLPILPMTGRQTISDTHLQAMGAEILSLYAAKVRANVEHQLYFISGSDNYCIYGTKPENMELMTPDGTIAFRPDGMPVRYIGDPIKNWKQVERAMSLAVANLRALPTPKSEPAAPASTKS